MDDATYRKIVRRHANAPKEAFDELLTVQEWRERLERVPLWGVIEICGVAHRRTAHDEWHAWTARRWRSTADLASWAHAGSMEVLGVQTDGIVAPEADSGCEAGDSA